MSTPINFNVPINAHIRNTVKNASQRDVLEPPSVKPLRDAVPKDLTKKPDLFMNYIENDLKKYGGPNSIDGKLSKEDIKTFFGKDGDAMASKFDEVWKENGSQHDSEGHNAIDAQGLMKLQLAKKQIAHTKERDANMQYLLANAYDDWTMFKGINGNGDDKITIDELKKTSTATPYRTQTSDMADFLLKDTELYNYLADGKDGFTVTDVNRFLDSDKVEKNNFSITA